MAVLKLKGSVGTGGSTKGLPHNDPADFEAVKNRLVQLGYKWIAGVTNPKDNSFIRVIKLFQSIIKGHSKFDTGDGRVDLHGNTHRWLAAVNAPGWIDMTGKSGVGWKVTPGLAFGGKNSFTTTWMKERLELAGLTYRAKSLLINAAPPMWIRDMSPGTGGDAPGHKSHETGLDVDMRLPLLPPKTNDWDKLTGGTYTKYFHFDAAMAQVEAIKMMMNAEYIFFNDPRFISKGLTRKQANHGNHYHIRIRPPARIEGIFM